MMSSYLSISFVDRVVIITGAAGDLGWTIAEAFHANGAFVALLDIDVAAIDARVRASRVSPERYLALAVDLINPGSAASAVEKALARTGRIDALINNAAAQTRRGSVDNIEVADWQHALAVNLGGAFYMARAAIPAMRKAGRGVIVNVASQLGHVGICGAAAYTASKGGLISFTRTMALDHAKEGIRVVSLSPGAILTGRVTRLYGSREAAEAALVPMHPIGRLGRCEEIANAALFLCSDQAGFITGTDLLVDGGYTAQ
jgi:NAD(P)-dependent dehydrogenase (short-subunit alcohol dehydrogenase family)